MKKRKKEERKERQGGRERGDKGRREGRKGGARREEERKEGKKEGKGILSTENKIAYIETPQKYIYNIVGVIDEFSKVLGFKIDIKINCISTKW